MKKLAVVIVLVLAAGGYVWFVHENKDDVSITSQSTNSSQSGRPNTATTPSTGTSGKVYKDGSYIGDAADAFYGMMQVQLVISGGKITDINFLQSPNAPGHTTEVSTQALPLLKQEAIQKQNSPVDVISGATQTSDAFNQSLASALAKAQ